MRSRLIFSALLLTALHAQDADPHMTGYSAIRAREEQAIERQFRAIPSPEEEKKQHRYFTAEPHPAGFERNHELALYVARLWNEQGLEDVRILRYDVLTSLPRSIAVEMVAPTAYRASLREDPCHSRRLSLHVGFRRSDRAAGLRAQRQSRRLRRAAPPPHKRKREDRVGALLEPLQLPRLQSSHRAECGRRRPAHLFRSGRRRLRARQGVPRWTMGTREPHPARLDHLRFPGSRRSAHAWLGFGGRRQTHPEGGSRLAAENHGRRHVLAGCQAATRAHGWSAGAQDVAGRPALSIPSRRRRRTRTHEGGYGHQPQAQLRGGGPHPGQRVSRRVDRAWQSPGRLGIRRGRSIQRHGILDGTDPRPGPTE